MIVAYDLDGVLAESPRESKPWKSMSGRERQERKMYLLRHYHKASVLYNPPEKKFYVITARKNDSKAISSWWLKRNFNHRILGVFFLNTSRTIQNVIAFKSGVLKQIKADIFIEDNKEVVKGIRKQCPGIEIKIFPEEVLK